MHSKLSSVLAKAALLTAITAPALSITAQASATSTANKHGSQLFYGGNIITMNKQQPSAEAVLVDDGKITAVGELKALVKQCQQANNCQQHDLQGKTLLPGFIDAHGHYTMTLDYLAFANVASAPVGPVKDIPGLIEQLRKSDTGEGWILGAGYDDSLLAEGRHPTRDDLDKVSSTRPVFIRHVSGHLGVCNSVCLKLAGVDKNTANPESGVLQRQAGSTIPNGVAEEGALDLFKHVIPKTNIKDQMKRLDTLNNYYAQYGITTVQDGATSVTGLELLAKAGKAGKLALDVVSYPYYNWVDLSKAKNQPGNSTDYKDGWRIGGIKLVLDGSPQGKTAWLAHPYHVPPEGQKKDYSGYPILKDDNLKTTLADFYKKGWKILAHANGDAAAEQMLRIMGELKAEGIHQPRSVMIHAQTVREDQLDRMNALDIIPSFFVAHTYYWGDWHRDSVLGEERAKRISPLRSATNKGIRYTIHNDTPIVPPNMPLLLWTAVNRETRSGKTLGAEQQSTVMEALEAITINAAYQHFEESNKGSLEVGKLADLVITEQNPLTMDKTKLKNLKIVETLKAGQSIYQQQ